MIFFCLLLFLYTEKVSSKDQIRSIVSIHSEFDFYLVENVLFVRKCFICWKSFYLLENVLFVRKCVISYKIFFEHFPCNIWRSACQMKANSWWFHSLCNQFHLWRPHILQPNRVNEYLLLKLFWCILLNNSFSNNISNETRNIYLINIATMDRKDRKGMYTNAFLHFLLAYNQVKQGLRNINI